MFVTHIVNLQHAYGVDWCTELLECWKKETRCSFRESFIIENIESLVQRLLATGGNIKLAEYLLNHQINALISNDKELEKAKPGIRNKSLKKRIDTIQKTINACISVPTVITFEMLIHHLMTHPNLYSETDLAELYLSFDKK